MGRTKIYDTPYAGDEKQMEAIFQEYLSCVVDCFGEQYDDRNNEKRASSLRSVCDEFDISIPKARKLLITAGVYSTKQSRQIAELYADGKSLQEIMIITGLSRSSVSSYLPYQRFSYNMKETTRHALDSRKYRERKKVVEQLHKEIIGKDNANIEETLWKTVVSYQNYLFHTSSGLPFSYTVKRKKNGDYSGELIISRKEDSKTLTRSSVILSFHKVYDAIAIGKTDQLSTVIIPAEYKGPKSIGQIFGISYVYSLFWKWGLIKVPEKIENNLRGKQNSSKSE